MLSELGIKNLKKLILRIHKHQFYPEKESSLTVPKKLPGVFPTFLWFQSLLAQEHHCNQHKRRGNLTLFLFVKFLFSDHAYWNQIQHLAQLLENTLGVYFHNWLHNFTSWTFFLKSSQCYKAVATISYNWPWYLFPDRSLQHMTI